MRPANVPSNPQKIYKHDGWQGWGHWLGTGNTCTKQFLPFEEALAVARSLGLANTKAWYAWSKSGARPANVPSNPERTYRHTGWLGWEHWLWHANPDTASAAASRPSAKRAADSGTQSMALLHRAIGKACRLCVLVRALLCPQGAAVLTKSNSTATNAV